MKNIKLNLKNISVFLKICTANVQNSPVFREKFTIKFFWNFFQKTLDKSKKL